MRLWVVEIQHRDVYSLLFYLLVSFVACTKIPRFDIDILSGKSSRGHCIRQRCVLLNMKKAFRQLDYFLLPKCFTEVVYHINLPHLASISEIYSLDGAIQVSSL